MIEPTQIIESFFEVFDKSSIHDFRLFLARNSGVTKWVIAGDYCLHDKGRPNGAFVFSIIPYDDCFGALGDEIRAALPRDLKDTKILSHTATEFLSDDRRFHVAFIFNRDPLLFTNGLGSVPLNVARECVDITYRHVVAMERSAETIQRLHALRQASLANSFNVELLTDFLLLSWFYPFVSILLARERRINVLGWFSDRDKMTTWSDGVVWDFACETLHALAERYGISLPNGCPIIGVPNEEKKMWFDEFVRVSDYIAGLLAAWNFASNEIPAASDKYIRLATDVFADSRNISVIRIDFDEEGTFQCGRLVAFKSAVPDDIKQGPR